MAHTSAAAQCVCVKVSSKVVRWVRLSCCPFKDGKIRMECYGGLFEFFTSLVQEKFNKYSLSKALRVTITG